MIRMRVIGPPACVALAPPMRAGADGRPRRRLHHRSPPLPQPPKASCGSWRGHRSCDTCVLATVHAERSYIVVTDSSSKCHNFLSMSPGAESFPPIVTSLSPDCCGYSSSDAARRAARGDRPDRRQRPADRGHRRRGQPPGRGHERSDVPADEIVSFGVPDRPDQAVAGDLECSR